MLSGLARRSGNVAAADARLAGSARAGPRALAPLPPPRALAPFVSSVPAGGSWRPAGRRVGGLAAIYETTLEEPGAPGAVAGVAWMDTRLLRARLYSGSLSPGWFSYGWKYTAPILPADARVLVAAFNGGFKFPASDGGYYSESHLAWPLRNGAASLVIDRDGSVTVGMWGRDVTMSPRVAAVRQNLNLIVDHGAPVAGLDPYDTSAWGSTLGGVPNVWRSGLGVTAAGALVYVGGPSLDVVQLAELLARAGAVRAMELDINTNWTQFSTYAPNLPSVPASASNGTDLLPTMFGYPARFFEPSWARDFVVMLAR
jgi:hypothetical protein